MNLFLQGILWGLTLSILVGPILFALIQTGLERGLRAGMMVGLGIWISDLMFICGVYWGLIYLMRITEWPGFTLWLGTLGGIILIILGTSFFVAKPPDMKKPRLKKQKAVTYFKLLSKGFLINTFNPFTFFFWISISGAVILKNDLDRSNAMLFYAGILATIIVMDSLKVGMAKAIGHYMKPKYILLTRRIAGVMLVAFGIGLIIRVIFYS